MGQDYQIKIIGLQSDKEKQNHTISETINEESESVAIKLQFYFIYFTTNVSIVTWEEFKWHFIIYSVILCHERLNIAVIKKCIQISFSVISLSSCLTSLTLEWF